MSKQKQILNEEEISLKLERLAYEIYENNLDQKVIVLAGIQKRGLAIAEVLQKKIDKLSKGKTRLISILIDKRNPIDCSLSDTKNLDKKAIVLIDDVANSGRTLLYALNPFLNVIAKRIQICVLVDRKHKSYPVSADYIGMQLSTTLEENIVVDIVKGKIKGAYLE
jgi:pyrimidine operon attenuation protein/uracil phosphoribosyltransferase